MTLRVSLDEIRTRVAERRRQKVDRAAALRARGVAVIDRRNYSKIIPSPRGLARLLPWRRREP